MPGNITSLLENSPLITSAPCRLDMGGTLDIKTIHLPMAHLSPATFNLALDMRTEVSLFPYAKGIIKVSSRGFDNVEFETGEAPYHHPLGLIFAIADHYNASGIHVDINSASPPRSALGGSSAAAVALVCALETLRTGRVKSSGKLIALTAHAIEEGVAQVSCGLQDHLAAVYGGVNAWTWYCAAGQIGFKRRMIFNKTRCLRFNDCFIVAYCGIPHVSRDINGRWMNHFIAAEDRGLWKEIIHCSNAFIEELAAERIDDAIPLMNRESDLRKQMTPDVFDDMGEGLVDLAKAVDCGARFTGAGGGGCVWALGQPENIKRLKKEWDTHLKSRQDACLLKTRIDSRGVVVHEGVPLGD